MIVLIWRQIQQQNNAGTNTARMQIQWRNANTVSCVPGCDKAKKTLTMTICTTLYVTKRYVQNAKNKIMIQTLQNGYKDDVYPFWDEFITFCKILTTLRASLMWYGSRTWHTFFLVCIYMYLFVLVLLQLLISTKYINSIMVVIW